jgi:Vacuolar protein sorting-associated protein 62
MSRLSGLAVLAGLCLVVLSGSAAGGRAATPSLGTLLARYVPVLVLHPEEQFQPVPVEGFLADSDVTQKTATGWVPVPGPLPAGGADLRLDERYCKAIDGLEATPCYVQAEAAHAASPVAYGAALRTKTRIALQYWLWYPYDDYSAPFSQGQFSQVHEGDWESVSVILNLAGQPLTLALSAHCKGSHRDWGKAPKRGVRPLVYVALGSHANYFGTGLHRHDPVCWPPEARDIVRALRLADRTAVGPTIRPRLVRLTATTPSWMTFAGAWGETGYLHFPNNAPVAYGAGPRGPAFHPQWRRPVAEVLSWPPG